MADKSSIEWTDATWNPVTGCSRVSAGCENCYAERLAATRMKNHPSRQGLTDPHGRWNSNVRFNGQWLGQPLRWQRPRRIFTVAHGDLFHERIPRDWVDMVFAVMAMASQHQFQVLTKRPERMRDYLYRDRRDRAFFPESSEGEIRHWLREGARWAAQIHKIPAPSDWQGQFAGCTWPPEFDWPLPNVWPGVSAEDQPTVDKRARELRKIPAAVRWLSLEPLLGPVEIDDLLSELDWVVAGGESGPGARPMDPAWVRSLRNQCICAGVPFFFKQWGGATSKAGGCELDGRTWQQMPEGAS